MNNSQKISYDYANNTLFCNEVLPNEFVIFHYLDENIIIVLCAYENSAFQFALSMVISSMNKKVLVIVNSQDTSIGILILKRDGYIW